MGREKVLTQQKEGYREILETLERILGKVMVINSRNDFSKQKKDEAQKILAYCIKTVTEATSEQTINMLVIKEYKKINKKDYQ